MNKEVQDKVFQYIDALADKLGVAVERVYEVMYKQMIVEGIISAVTAVISILIITVGTKYFLKLMNYLREKAEDTYEDRWSVLIVISWIIYLILLVISIISLYIDIPMAIGKLANPEYYLMKDIMEMVKK
ncbi:hypothetical protein [Bacillus mycoides]|uniref:hypothetical protein n=1 Tax=Bacillus mycoides TaxID=1405 RepID=UPI000BF53E6A|nr:hypothetical protein [Bacillus mycoides]PGA05545.1 hypothetical protein COL71_25345 [Bacillus mycoides]